MIEGANVTDTAAPSESTEVVSNEFMSGEPEPEQRRVEIDINKLDEEIEDPAAPEDVTGEPAAANTIPGNDTPEENARWAQMRREAEEAKQLKQELVERDKWVEETFGASHGLHDWKSYQNAVAETQKMQAQQQARSFDEETAGMVRQMQEEGYDPLSIQLYTGQRALQKQNEQLAQELATMKGQTQKQTAAQQAEIAHQKNLQKVDESFAELQAEYPEIKDLDSLMADLGEETWTKIAKKYGMGYSLLDAYESTNRQALKQKTVAAVKQKTVNDLNSKKHLKTEGDGATEAASTTTLDPETLGMYMDSGMTEKQARAFHKKLYG